MDTTKIADQVLDITKSKYILYFIMAYDLFHAVIIVLKEIILYEMPFRMQ